MPQRDEWTPLHHLAYAYAAIASVDGSVSKEELEVLCERLRQWKSDIADRELVSIVMAAVSALGSDLDAADLAQLKASLDVLGGSLDAETRGALLDDLISIAGADGVFQPGEGDVLLLIRDALEEGPGTAPRHHLND